MSKLKIIIRDLVIAVLTVLLPFEGNCQLFKVIQVNKDAYYDVQGVAHSATYDSISLIGSQDTIFHFTNIWKKSELGDTCSYNNRPSLFGKKLVVNGESKNYLFNKDGDTITFLPEATEGTTYTCYNYPDSFRIDITYETMINKPFFFRPVNAQILRFQAKDTSGNAIQHPINGVKLTLTEFFGVMRTLDFYNFPDDTTTYPIVGIRDSTGLQQKINVRNTFNIKPGTERHFRRDSFANGNLVKTELNKLFTIESSISGDTATLAHKRFAYRIDHGIGDTVQVIDTLVERFPLTRYNYLDKNSKSISRYFNAQLDTTLVRYLEVAEVDSLGLNYTKIVKDGFYFHPTVACLRDSLIRTISAYKDGLGRVLFNTDSLRSQLIYYKKGLEKWGEPFDFSNFTGINTPASLSFSISPNPFKDQLKITIDGGTEYGKVEVFDITGRRVGAQQVSGSKFINTAQWDQGIYIVKLSSSKGHATKKVLKTD